ncbi:beta-propeller domain-containing protein [Longirhabdus pacifica]|uniref:beta-propeller domain-containing protein n=1 Tax=Longirhabdus pacifica TaxID=2305227 RepID=UPI0010092B3C|nr:beta-propeller domain-containing protein [Longirhabdus pacifica]
MRKGITWFLLIALILSPLTLQTYAQAQSYFVTVDGEPLVLSDGGVIEEKGSSLFVPLEDLTNQINAHIERKENGTVIVSKDGFNVTLTPLKDSMLMNGEDVALPYGPYWKEEKLMVPLRSIVEGIGASVYWQQEMNTASIFTEPTVGDAVLTQVGSYEQLKLLAEQYQNNMKNNIVVMFNDTLTLQSEEPFTVKDEASITSNDTAAEESVSETNVQVQGVDEADVIKTDGQYMYQISENKLLISDVMPAEKMKVVNEVTFEHTFTPTELYVDDRYLVVIGNSWEERYDMDGIHKDSTPDESVEEDLEVQSLILPEEPYFPRNEYVAAYVYDLQDRTNLQLIRSLKMEGYYMTSRKIDDTLYFVSNYYQDVYDILNTKDTIPSPVYQDSNIHQQLTEIGYDRMYYFPQFDRWDYTLIGSVNLAMPEVKMDVNAYVGGAETVYASKDHLYLAVPAREGVEVQPLQADNVDKNSDDESTGPDEIDISMETETDVTVQIQKIDFAPAAVDTITKIYKFSLGENKVKFKAEGQVPGHVLNQFSMDEYEGDFRIATTSGQHFGWGEEQKNNVYVLDEQLNQLGKIEDIAPGEKIYSVRFMGDRGYMVTFKTVDPLFVIDFSESDNPNILGQLKIPGYSDYLHPYDENHLIGFGKDTVEVDVKDRNGNTVGTTAYYQGMKMALFDVSDVSNPIEKHKVMIGDRGTHSELLHNHKALTFHRDMNLLAFPVTVMEVNEADKNNVTAYGSFAFQGAHIYHISAEDGFQLRGEITHLTEDDIQKSGHYWSDREKTVQRIMYIGDTLYTISPSKIEAHDFTTLETIQELQLKK